MLRGLLLLPFALLAACEGESTRVVINSSGEVAKPGTVEAGSGGFKADIAIPGIARMGNMNVDGVSLYPGAKLAGVNIDAKSGSDNDQVVINFTSSDDRAKVASWYQGQFRDKGFKAQTTPTGFAGTTKDGDSFTLDLTDADGSTAGAFKVANNGR